MRLEISPRQAELHNASFEMSNGTVWLRDPFTGDDLSKNHPPRSMEQLAGLAGGYEYLRNNPDIRVHIYGEPHREDVDKGRVESALAEADVVFLEMFDNTEEVQDVFWDVSLKGGAEVSHQLASDIGEYKMRQMEALVDVQKPVFLPEVARDGSDYDDTLIEYYRVVDKLLPLALDGDDDVALAAEIAVSVSTMLRDWYMIGKMGLQMQAYERATGKKLKNPLLWIGPAHAKTMPSKFQSLGIRSRADVGETFLGTLHEGNAVRPNGQIDMVDAATNGLARIVKKYR